MLLTYFSEDVFGGELTDDIRKVEAVGETTAGTTAGMVDTIRVRVCACRG